MADTIKKYVSLAKLGLYDEKIKKYLGDADAAKLQEAKDYADGLASNYEKSGAVATAKTELTSYVDGQVATLNTAIAKAEKAGTDAAAAAAVADGKAVVAQGDVDALETYVGTLPEGRTEASIVEYINKKAEETLSAATGDGGESAASVKAQLDTYKTSNDAKVNANATAAAEAKTAADNAQAAADAAQLHSEGVADDLAEAITTLEAADAGLGTRITTLEGQITGLTGAMHFIGVKDDVPSDVSGYNAGDVIVVGDKEYVFNNGEFVEFGDVSAEGERIGTLEGKVTTAEGKITTLEGEMDTVQGAVATKAEQSALDTEAQTRKDADDALSGRITTLEAAVGESGSVAEDIAAAKQEAIDTAKSYTDTQDGVTLQSAKTYADGINTTLSGRIDTLDAASATHALKSDVEALTGRVSTAEGTITDHGTRLSAVETLAAANKTAHEANAAAIALKADKTALDAAVARIDAVELWQTNMIEISEQEINEMFQ